ncbi:IS3 family transposase [Staphylococcus xylosus]
MENFFGLLKQEMFYREGFDHFYQLEQANQNYMIFYNFL